MFEKKGAQTCHPFPLDFSPSRCYSSLITSAQKEKNPQVPDREGRVWWKRSAEKRREYHSGAARDDRDGPARYSGHKRRPAGRKQGGTVERVFASPLARSGVRRFVLPRGISRRERFY